MKKQRTLWELSDASEKAVKEAIQISAVFIMQSEYDNDWKCATDNEEIRKWIEFVKECESCEVKLHYEPVDDAFVMEIHTKPVSKEVVYEVAKEEVKREFSSKSNRVGRRYEDGEEWIWYG